MFKNFKSIFFKLQSVQTVLKIKLIKVLKILLVLSIMLTRTLKRWWLISIYTYNYLHIYLHAYICKYKCIYTYLYVFVYKLCVKDASILLAEFFVGSIFNVSGLFS